MLQGMQRLSGMQHSVHCKLSVSVHLITSSVCKAPKPQHRTYERHRTSAGGAAKNGKACLIVSKDAAIQELRQTVQRRFLPVPDWWYLLPLFEGI